MARKAQYRVPVPAKPKSAPKQSPNFPQHEIGPPLGELQTLGRPVDAHEAAYRRLAQSVRAGDTARLAAQLLTMALDETYYEYEGETDPRPYTRAHAVAVLTELADLEAVRPAIEPLLPLLGEEDDWLREEMPFFYAAVGEPAIEPLTDVLNNGDGDTFERAGAGESLQEMAEKHPELRNRVVGILEQALVQEEEDVELTGFLVCNLLDVGAKESLPIIRQAFEDDKVDDSIVQMADVEEHFGLPVTTPRRDWRQEIAGLPFGEPVDQSQFDAEPDAATDEAAPSKPYVGLPKVGRNDLCPCGSGKKYKKCHGAAV